jgi:peptide/nickel transport system permease protein
LTSLELDIHPLSENLAPRLWQNVWRQLRQNRLAMLGLVTLGTILLGVTLGPLLYSVPFNQIDFSQSTLFPGWQHPLGTNDLGQDQLARILIGGRISLAVALTAMVIAIFLGTLIGSIAGFYGGIIDAVLMRMSDLFLSLPPLPLVLLVVYLFRESLKAIAGPEVGIFGLVVLVIGGLNWMSLARLVRATVLQLREMEFVTAAQSLGASPRQILQRHILPHILSIIIVSATLSVGNAILTESTLSFLGLGFPPDVPTWGQMLYQSKDYLSSAPYLAIFPGMLIFLTVLSINYFGDGLRDSLDPKSRA